ncbi:hypothetical protein BDZ91DRAFT_714808, partial [Kalaharituber pfeilii]
DAIKKKVNSFIIERKAELTARESLSGVAIPASTDLDQAIDAWIELVERRTEVKQRKLGNKAQVKLEKEIASIRRDNLSKPLSQKHTYQEVVRQVMDLTESFQATSSTAVKRDKRRRIGQVQSMMKETLDLFRASITSVPKTTVLPPNPSAPLPPSPVPLPPSPAPLPNRSAPVLNPPAAIPNPLTPSDARLAFLKQEINQMKAI